MYRTGTPGIPVRGLYRTVHHRPTARYWRAIPCTTARHVKQVPFGPQAQEQGVDSPDRQFGHLNNNILYVRNIHLAHQLTGKKSLLSIRVPYLIILTFGN